MQDIEGILMSRLAARCDTIARLTCGADTRSGSESSFAGLVNSLWNYRRERPDRAPEREPERRILAYLSTGSAARAREAGAPQISPQAVNDREGRASLLA